MRVLHLLKTSTGGGWAFRQIRELIKLGVDLHVALPDQGPFVGKYAEVGATEHLLQTSFPTGKPWLLSGRLASLSSLVNAIEPDLIHSHFVGTTLSMRFCPGKCRKIPKIFQVPGPLHLEHLFYRYLEIKSAGKFDYWIGSCKWTCARYIQSGVDPSKVFLSYYGTDLDNFYPRTPGKLKKELNLSDNTKIVGMVAFMYPPKHYLGQRRGLKGHEDLIDAFRICLDRNPDLCCVIVGGAWGASYEYENYLKKYAFARCGDHVVFLGTRNDVPDLYADFDVSVNPSLSENVGAAGEACLLGVPTIATRIGGFPDIIRDGETGWLVPPQNPAALAEAIMESLADPVRSKQRALAGQRLARELFNVQQTSAEIKQIYSQILSV